MKSGGGGLKKALIAAAALLALLILGVGGCVLLTGGDDNGDGALGEANAFMGDLDNGRYDDAFDRIPQECRNDNYADEVNDVRDRDLAGLLSGFDLELASGGDEDSDEATVNGTATLGDREADVELDLVRAGDDWDVCSFQIR